jgi:putative ABC transport system ATP-binding protein
VERRGKLERIAVRFRDNDHIASVAQKIAAQVGRRVDESSPMVDCRLPDGSRVNIILPPLAIHSPCISIRKFPSHRLDMAGMIANGTMNEAMGQLLEIAGRARLNILVSGGTGSGKTTLLNMLGALDTPTAGHVVIDGEDLDAMSPAALSDLRMRKLGFVFQAYNLIPVFSARENVEFVMELQGVPAGARRRRALEALAEVGLDGLGAKRPLEMSGGEPQRVAVARAIVSRPRLVLADEPTANLDSETAGLLLELMGRLNREHDTTFLFSTHDPAVMRSARRLVTLRDGRIVKDERKNSSP